MPPYHDSWSQWYVPLVPPDWSQVEAEPFTRNFLNLKSGRQVGKANKHPRHRRPAVRGTKACRNRLLLLLRSHVRAHNTLKARRQTTTLRTCSPHRDSSDVDSNAMRGCLRIRIEDDPYNDCPAPIKSFEELGILPSYILQGLRENGITNPMPIQSQALPLVLSGRDVIGLAHTGSGKTLAFLLPAIVHIEAQQAISPWDPTPIALILAPTRELAVQISSEAAKVLSKSSQGKHSGGLRAVSIYGGGDKKEQLARLRRASHIISATPGRLIDFIKAGAVSLRRVTYFVLDEADRMLDMGFHGDVTSISAQVRPDRQVLFFSATWNACVQNLSKNLCQKGSCPVRISQGQDHHDSMLSESACLHKAREGITQQVVVIDHGGNWETQAQEKRKLLEEHLRQVLSESEEHKVLVFVNQKLLADSLAAQLQKDGFKADVMHGGKTQDYRLWSLDQFRKGYLRLLVCTDVLGRGIDIPSVSHVVVHEMGSIEDYVHRIGRTARGRYGKGHALVFFEFWNREPEIASQLIDVLRSSGQEVPGDLQRIASEASRKYDKASGYHAASWSKTMLG